MPASAAKVTPSEKLSKAALIRGTVAGPAAAGSTVVAEAWPTDEKLATYTVGEHIPVTTIAVGQANARGEYELRVDPDVDTDALVSQAGMLDIEVVAYGTDGNTGATALTLDLADEAGDFTNEQNERGYVRTRADGTPAGRTASVDVTMQPKPRGFSTANINECPVSGTTLVRNLGGRPVIVGRMGVRNGAATATMTYKSSSSSTLGVGVSPTGKSGSFTASGTSSFSSTGAVSWEPTTSQMRIMRTSFRYGLYCTTVRSPGPSYTYRARANQWNGGAPTPTTTTPPAADFCVQQGNASTFRLDESVARTHAAGVSISGVIGINLSSRTGYTTNTSQFFRFNKSGQLCGTKGFPGGTPRELVAK